MGVGFTDMKTWSCRRRGAECAGGLSWTGCCADRAVTTSAAEILVQALLGRGGVTRIGEPTQGVFCDVLGRRLPNGWNFGLPNALYRTAPPVIPAAVLQMRMRREETRLWKRWRKN